MDYRSYSSLFSTFPVKIRYSVTKLKNKVNKFLPSCIVKNCRIFKLCLRDITETNILKRNIPNMCIFACGTLLF